VKKIIARIKGGLGNQLFCYAAARRLALVNDAELVIDDVTGFARDRQYHRRYGLDHFHIPVRKATRAERLEPFDRYRRVAMNWLSRRKPFAERHYVEQEGNELDERLLALNVAGTIYLDGMWQSENYFKDVEQTIREDLRIVPPIDASNSDISEAIRGCNAVAVHVRKFSLPGSAATHDASPDYYRRAIVLTERKIGSPHYFLFSDDPEAARAMVPLPESRVTCVFHNRGNENAHADLWLMAQCKHFITANSTFSWWGAWLSNNQKKEVVTPDVRLEGTTAWGFKGLIPGNWAKL